MVKMETYLQISGRFGGVKVKDCSNKDKRFFKFDRPKTWPTIVLLTK